MKKILLSALFTFSSLCAFEPLCELPPYPIGLSGTYLRAQPASLCNAEFADQHLLYVQSNASFAYTHACNPCCGFIFGSGYVGTEVNWNENPFFSEKFFSYVTLNLGGYTKALPDWTWIITGTMFLDTAILDFREYALYQGVLYGKYSFSRCLTFDAGFLLEVGLARGRAWPVIGFEYDPNDRFSLHLVYPYDMTIAYDIIPTLTLAGSLRFLRDRHRVLETNPLPMAIYEYEAVGYEVDLTFSPCENVAITGFAGRTFDGRLRISNQGNHHPVYVKFNSSFYSGASALFVF